MRGARASDEAISVIEEEIASPTTLAMTSQPEPIISLARQNFILPDRHTLPHLSKYAYLIRADGQCPRVGGYTEASRGCKHHCRHCPVVPVYGGQFRVVPSEIVIEDIEQQVESGAGHITFGDPDFFNGPGHVIPIVEKVHQLWPHLTYDVTIKIEHLLKYQRWLPLLRDTGCAFVTSAVESIDDGVLEIFAKGHTREDFLKVAALFKEIGLVLQPTFVTFNPWTTLSGYLDLMQTIAQLDLVENVAPIQWGVRLLIPAGSLLLDRAEVRSVVGEFDEAALAYRWAHPDPRVDQLCEDVLAIVKDGQDHEQTRSEIFDRVWQAACEAAASDDASYQRILANPCHASARTGSVERNLWQSRWLWSTRERLDPVQLAGGGLILVAVIASYASVFSPVFPRPETKPCEVAATSQGFVVFKHPQENGTIPVCWREVSIP